MKAIYIKIPALWIQYVYVIIAIVFFSSCDGKNGYMTPYENERLELLTGTKWIRIMQDDSNPDNAPSYELWTFYKNTKCTCETGTIVNDKLIVSDTDYQQWQFTTSNYSVLYFTSGKYWLINRLDASTLNVSQTWEDPVITPDQSAINKEFVAF
jgi:hypothetical protein